MGQQIDTDDVFEPFFSNVEFLKVLANLGMPDDITLSPSSFSSLGEAMNCESVANLEVLQKRYGNAFDSLLKMTAIRLTSSFKEWAEFCNSRRPNKCTKPLHWLDVGKDYSHAFIFSQHIRRKNFAEQILIPDEDWMSIVSLLWLAKASSLITSGDVKSALNWIYVGQYALAIEGEIQTEIINDCNLSLQRSESGKKSAPKRHEKSFKLREWVDIQPEAMAGSVNATKRARLMSNRMPAELSNAFDDPVRTIRDYLLEKEKLRLAGQP